MLIEYDPEYHRLGSTCMSGKLFSSILVGLVAALIGTMVHADTDSAILSLGGDTFSAGRVVSHDEAGADDVFLAGERVSSKADIAGSAHLAGRHVVITGRVGADVYAAGETVELLGAIAGDATVAGRAVHVNDVGGDVRAAGSEVELDGAITGYAMIAAEQLRFDADVAGDVSLAVESVEWGEAALIRGRLLVYEEEPGSLLVPERIVADDRIVRHGIEDWEGPSPPSVQRVIGGFLVGVVIVAALAALIAALVPERLADMRRLILDRPFRTLWIGFLTQSAIIGASVLMALTLIGLLLTPGLLLIAVVSGFAGYVVAAYALGVGVLNRFGRALPDSFGDRALAAGVGALVAGILGLIPFLGWLFVLALVLTGIGAILIRWCRPVFFSDISVPG